MSQRSSDLNAAAGRLPPADPDEQSGIQEDARVHGELRAVRPDSLEVMHLDRGAAGDKSPEPPRSTNGIERRMERLERQNFRMKLALVLLVLVVGYLAFDQVISGSTIIKQTMMESRELKLLDKDGNARLFLRMYSRVPVLQLLDSHGKPRMSLGMRFDDTPFIDLSDKSGQTRASLELTEDEEPALRLFDEHGETTFKIN